MSDDKRALPVVFIALGISFLGVGVAMSAALAQSGLPMAGMGMFGLGIVFIVLGVAKRREARRQNGDEDEHSS
ncbi:MAG: hypothetical protein GF405_03175 [Candidatus Eisenbacteria bacterium]|nr:hypothetical protein [Candidatus Eisenbacteria bacterium]